MAAWSIRDFVPFVPAWWFSQRGLSSVWVRVYRVYGVHERDLVGTMRLLPDSDVVAVLFPGSIAYTGFDEPEVKEVQDTGSWVGQSTLSRKETGPGVYAVLMTRYEKDGGQSDEAGAKQRLDVAAGFVASFQPWTLFLDIAFENPLHLEAEKATFIGPAILNLDWFGSPRLDGPYRQMMAEGYRALEALPADDRARMGLALRWHDMAVRERSGVDAFLKHWVSMETLAMPDDTDIRPLVEALADHYSITYEEARDRFLVGRIYGRRGAIVHAGDMRPVDARLLEYMAALFIDLVRHKLGVHPAHRTGRLLDQPGFDLAAYL